VQRFGLESHFAGGLGGAHWIDDLPAKFER
jgi:hypothetical protein